MVAILVVLSAGASAIALSGGEDEPSPAWLNSSASTAVPPDVKGAFGLFRGAAEGARGEAAERMRHAGANAELAQFVASSSGSDTSGIYVAPGRGSTVCLMTERVTAGVCVGSKQGAEVGTVMVDECSPEFSRPTIRLWGLVPDGIAHVTLASEAERVRVDVVENTWYAEVSASRRPAVVRYGDGGSIDVPYSPDVADVCKVASSG